MYAVYINKLLPLMPEVRPCELPS